MAQKHNYRICKWKVFKALDRIHMKRAELADELGVCPSAVLARYNVGWSKADALLLCRILMVSLPEILED